MNKISDFRSDTVTRPTPKMRQAMAEAEVGDDVLGDDPTVQKLEELAAATMGKEAGLFCPSGTTGNDIVRIIDHQVNVERQGRFFLKQGHETRAERQVGDIVAVHDIDMDQVCPRRLGELDRLFNSCEIRRKDGGSDEDHLICSPRA